MYVTQKTRGVESVGTEKWVRIANHQLQVRIRLLPIEQSCKVNGIISVDLRFNRLLSLFPRNPFLKPFELILSSDAVRSPGGVRNAARITCRDSRSSSSEKISMTSPLLLSSLSRLTPFPLLFPPSGFTEGAGERLGGGEGIGDWGTISCALRISDTRNLNQNCPPIAINSLPRFRYKKRKTSQGAMSI